MSGRNKNIINIASNSYNEYEHSTKAISNEPKNKSNSRINNNNLNNNSNVTIQDNCNCININKSALSINNNIIKLTYPTISVANNINNSSNMGNTSYSNVNNLKNSTSGYNTNTTHHHTPHKKLPFKNKNFIPKSYHHHSQLGKSLKSLMISPIDLMTYNACKFF